jgi:hypothetical protein
VAAGVVLPRLWFARHYAEDIREGHYAGFHAWSKLAILGSGREIEILSTVTES